MAALDPTDVRHGTNAGYVAGCREACCREAHYLANKERDLRRAEGTPITYTVDEVEALFAPWDALGVSRACVAGAAGLAHGHAVHGPVRRSTYTALARVTEADLPGNAWIHADLTRTRIYSLMAAGHRLVDIPVNPRGYWRHRRGVLVDIARRVRDYYEAHQHETGPSALTAARATNAGHQTPATWDDPGTLAWPLGWTVPLPTPEVDEVLVERVLAGEYELARQATHAERVVVVALFRARQLPLKRLEQDAGIKPERYRVVGAA